MLKLLLLMGTRVARTVDFVKCAHHFHLQVTVLHARRENPKEKCCLEPAQISCCMHSGRLSSSQYSNLPLDIQNDSKHTYSSTPP